MDNTKKQTGVFYLERGKASFFTQSNLNGYYAQIPIDTVNDMEIVNEEKMTLLIKRFLEANKVNIGTVIIVLSLDYTYESDFDDDTSEKLMERLKNFQDVVPFENVDSKIIKQDKKWKVICVSKDLCEKLRRVFEKISISVLGVISYSQLRTTFPEMSNKFEPKIVLEKADSIKLSGFINQEQKNTVSEQTDRAKAKNGNLPILIVVLVSLFAILLLLIYFNYLR